MAVELRKCRVSGCSRAHKACGYCDAHYQSQRRLYQRLFLELCGPLPELPGSAQRSCSVKACGNKYHARGYCRKHYQRVLDTGKPDGLDRRRNYPGGAAHITFSLSKQLKAQTIEAARTRGLTLSTFLCELLEDFFRADGEDTEDLDQPLGPSDNPYWKRP